MQRNAILILLEIKKEVKALSMSLPRPIKKLLLLKDFIEIFVMSNEKRVKHTKIHYKRFKKLTKNRFINFLPSPTLHRQAGAIK